MDLETFLRSTDLQFAAAAALLALVATALALSAWLRLRRLQRRLRAFLPPDAGADVVEALAAVAERLAALERTAEELAAGDAALRAEVARRIGTPAVVRFNAFPGMGSELSFAVALLDDDGTGVVLSAIQGREDVRVYAKPVQRGRSPYLLTPEEERAIQSAGRRQEVTN
ncbi:MAG: DUF4446 family protein [Firmicutes bacterium]|nr:DUF4446 family protein [Bacillota bacterium]